MRRNKIISLKKQIYRLEGIKKWKIVKEKTGEK